MSKTQYCTVCKKSDHNTDKCWGPGTLAITPVYRAVTYLPAPTIGNSLGFFMDISIPEYLRDILKKGRSL